MSGKRGFVFKFIFTFDNTSDNSDEDDTADMSANTVDYGSVMLRLKQ